MASSDSVAIKKALAVGTFQKVGTDTPIAIRIRNKANKAVTSVTVTTGTDIVLIDSDGTTTSTFATDTTLAAVVARINASANWEAKLLDALSTQASVSTLLNGAITAGKDANGVTVYDVLQDTSALKELTICVSPFRDFDQVKGGRLVHILETKYLATLGAAAADKFQIWRRTKAGVETKIYGELSVSAAATSQAWTAGTTKITGTQDGELIVRLLDGTSIADAAANYLQVSSSIE